MKVLIPNQLQAYTHGDSSVSAIGQTLGTVLDDLDKQFPGIKFRAIDEQGRIRKHLKIFVSGELASNLDIAIATTDEIQIVGALSGG